MSAETNTLKVASALGHIRCACCGRKQYLLKDGTWTHLVSKAMSESFKESFKEDECLVR